MEASISKSGSNRILEKLRDFDSTWQGVASSMRLDLADEILDALDQKQMTQRELAKKMGVKESFISRLIHANSNCKISTIAKVFHALDLAPAIHCKARPTVEHENRRYESIDFSLSTPIKVAKSMTLESLSQYVATRNPISFAEEYQRAL